MNKTLQNHWFIMLFKGVILYSLDPRYKMFDIYCTIPPLVEMFRTFSNGWIENFHIF